MKQFQRALTFLLLTCAFFSTNAQSLSGVENYALNRPGVVMIKTVFSANVYVNKMNINNRRFNRLLDSIRRAETSGAILAAEQKLDIVLTQMNNNPGRFFTPTLDYIKQEETITATGTGFFITGDGYIATNCHLIDRENAFIRQQFLLTAFRRFTEANIAALEASWATTFTEQQRNLLYNTYASVYSRLFSMAIYDLKKEVYAVYRTDVWGKEPTTQRRPASVIIKGTPMPGKDIAILKIDGDSLLPTLSLATNIIPQVGEQLYVYGYPAPVTNNDFVAQESAIEPTLTTGIISAIKKSINGWPVIQMDANINHGSSGGPVCNKKGDVIGLTTFGSLENSGGLAAGLNFAIPVSILREYLDSVDIVPRMSKSSLLFSEGISQFERGYFQRALSKFQAVKKLNSGYPGLAYYISESKNNVKNGNDQELASVRYDMIGFGMLLLLMAIFYLLLRNKKTLTR